MKQTGPASMYNILEYPNYFVIKLGTLDQMTFYRSRYDRITVEWIKENLDRAYRKGYEQKVEEDGDILEKVY